MIDPKLLRNNIEAVLMKNIGIKKWDSLFISEDKNMEPPISANPVKKNISKYLFITLTTNVRPLAILCLI